MAHLEAEIGQFQIGGGNIPLSFQMEVSKGNIRGHSFARAIGRNISIGAVFEDITGAGNSMSLPSVAESWEIVSDEAADSSAGTGARTVIIESLDADYKTQFTTVTLNGTTPVAISGTHIRPRTSTVATVGSSEANVGLLLIRVAGGGVTRNTIMPIFSISQDAMFTVPAGKRAFGLQAVPFYPKDRDGKIRTITRFFGSDTPRIIGAEFPFYQSGIVLPIVSSFPLPEKTDIIFQANSTNEGTEVDLSFSFMLVDLEVAP